MLNTPYQVLIGEVRSMEGCIDYPQVAGRVIPRLAWVEYQDLDGEKGLIQISRLDGDQWSTPISLGSGRFGVLSPDLQTTQDDRSAGLVWLEQREGLTRVMFAREKEPGNWQSPGPVLDEWGKYQNPSLIFDAQGWPWVSWEECLEGEYCIQVTRLVDGDTWEEPRVVSARGVPAYKPKLVWDSHSVAVVFQGYAGGQYQIMARQLYPRWDEALLTVSENPGQNLAPVACADPDGGFWVAWEATYPMEKGYAAHYRGLENPAIIPAFGHGLRVDSQVYLRHIEKTADQGWRISVLASEKEKTPDRSGRLGIRSVNNSIPGCPAIVCDNDGRLWFLYRTFDQRQRKWLPEITCFDGREWAQAVACDLEPSGVRSPLSLTVAGQKMIVASVVRQHQKKMAPLSTVSSRSLDLSQIAVPVGQAEIASPKGLRPKFLVKTVSRHDCQVRGMCTSTRKKTPRTTIEVAGESYTLYWGDLHMHSDFSRCSHGPFRSGGPLEDKYRYARDVGQLDFAMVADHGRTLTPYEWGQTRQVAALNNIDHVFAAFSGFEWTSSGQNHEQRWYGHRHVIYPSDDLPLYHCMLPESNTSRKLRDRLKTLNAVSIPHHPGDRRHPFDWDEFMPEVDLAVEIFQARGSYERDTCPWHPEQLGRSNIPHHSVCDGLKRGWRFGFTAGGEHEGVGVTAVYARALTRQAILEAVRSRRVYGTTGARIVIDFRINGAFMGQEISCDSEAEIKALVVGSKRLSRITLVKDGEDFATWEHDKKRFVLCYPDSSLTPGNHFYYLRVEQIDGEVGWSSPVWCRVDA